MAMNVDLDQEKAKENTKNSKVLDSKAADMVLLRCPRCNKLYKYAHNEVFSENPQFQCHSCSAEFTVNFKQKHQGQLTTRLLHLNANKISKTTLVNEILPCPKCGFKQSARLKECSRCRIVIGKYDPVSKIKGEPHYLVKAWKDLLNDYDNVAKHLSFVDQCDDLQAVPFALKKYQMLKEAQPQDPLPNQMMKHLMLKKIGERLNKVSFFRRSFSFVENVNWLRIRTIGPWIFYTTITVLGFLNPSLRNLISMGIALTFLHVGVLFFLRGKITLDDFWN